jgi:hypothetical protein
MSHCLPQSNDIPNHENCLTVKHNTSIKKYIELITFFQDLVKQKTPHQTSWGSK